MNLYHGCANNCLYCYARKMALRFKRIQSDEQWPIMQANKNAIIKRYKQRGGRIMFPSSHDLFPEHIEAWRSTIGKMLFAGNHVLITSKPRLPVIHKICESFGHFKTQIQFRFTITSHYSPDLQIWEPDAPSFQERMQCLIHAYNEGFMTSVSIEPYLEDPRYIIENVEPYTTESIWVGVMNKNSLSSKALNLYKELKMEKFYNRAYIVQNLPVWESKAKGKLRIKDSIKAMGVIL